MIETEILLQGKHKTIRGRIYAVKLIAYPTQAADDVLGGGLNDAWAGDYPLWRPEAGKSLPFVAACCYQGDWNGGELWAHNSQAAGYTIFQYATTIGDALRLAAGNGQAGAVVPVGGRDSATGATKAFTKGATGGMVIEGVASDATPGVGAAGLVLVGGIDEPVGTAYALPVHHDNANKPALSVDGAELVGTAAGDFPVVVAGVDPSGNVQYLHVDAGNYLKTHLGAVDATAVARDLEAFQPAGAADTYALRIARKGKEIYDVTAAAGAAIDTGILDCTGAETALIEMVATGGVTGSIWLYDVRDDGSLGVNQPQAGAASYRGYYAPGGQLGMLPRRIRSQVLSAAGVTPRLTIHER